jgi:prolyl oligopeptidase PreP (S9A serine peptidase family)
MAMFHCTDKKIALKGNLADYINKRGGVSKVTKLPSFRKEGWLKAGVVGILHN